MGIITSYICVECNFYLEDDKDSFYYDSEKHRTETYLLLFSTVRLADDSEIKGHTSLTYCKHCKKFIRTYCITDIPNDDLDNIKKILNKGIENEIKHLKEEIKKIEEKIKKIKEEKNYQIEKEEDEYYIFSPETHIEHSTYIDDYSSEEEALKNCKTEFFNLLDEYLEEKKKEYSIEKNAIKQIVYRKNKNNLEYAESSDTMICPNCNKEICRFIDSCPKCGNKMIINGIINAD